MSDIISQGRHREPRWPRWSRWQRAVVVAGVVVVLAGAIIWYLPRLHHPGARPGPSAAGAGPVMTGRQLPRDTRLRVPAGGRQPAWLSVATGRLDPVRGLPADGKSYQLFRVAGGWAVQPVPPYSRVCGICAPRPVPVYYLADGARSVRRLGAADFVAPAANAGALWLISFRPGANMGTTAATARQVSVAGRALEPRLTLPAGYLIDQATRAGLLLVPEVQGSGPARYELWDADTRRVTRTFVHLLAAAPAEIAWMPACTQVCRVNVLQLPADRTEVISLPRRSQADQAIFSPDGRLLALQVTARIVADRHPAATQLAVAAVSTGRLTVIPGSTVGVGNGVDFGWLAATGQLIAIVSVRNKWQIAVWRPGDTRLFVAHDQVPDSAWLVVSQGPY